jgi:hypothetical protein
MRLRRRCGSSMNLPLWPLTRWDLHGAKAAGLITPL